MLYFTLSLNRTDASDVREFNRAEFLLDESMTPPNAGDARWHRVTLPDLWSRNGYEADSGWYRIQIHADRIPEKLQGIYLFRLHMNAAVYFNGEFLGDGGRMEEPLARNWNRPLYFNVPHVLWRVGNNELLIHLKTYAGFGMLFPPQIAPDELLKPRFQTRQFLQNELSLAFTFMLTMVGVYTLVLWYKRRHDGMYLWFALSCFCWSIFNSSLFVRYPILINPVAYQKLTHIALDFWMLFLVGFMHRYLGLLHPRREQLLFGVQTLLALPFAALPMTSGYSITHIMHSISLGLTIYLATLAWRNWRKKPGLGTLFMANAFTALVLSALHDWLMENPIIGLLSWENMAILWRHQFHLLFFMVPVLILFLALHLTQRFVSALNESEQLNRELEQRVSAAQRVLAKHFKESRVLELGQATTNERERIYRDLHDDVGAKLLGLVISAQRANLPREADLARSALQDLRDVVSRSAQPVTTLGDLVADWRAETEQRLNPLGIILDWRIPLEDMPMPVSAEAALNLGHVK